MTQQVIPLIEQIDALLPQTQCGQCDHDGCLPYAKAMAAGEAHNKCPPGGHATLVRLETLLNRPSLALRLPEHKQPGIQRIARIREADCIGCTKCIQACPVDAIIGARQLMHAVLDDDCTGCELCIAPCPVDCIDLVAPPAGWLSPSLEDAGEQPPARIQARADRARRRYQTHQQRTAQQKARRMAEKQQRLAQVRTQEPVPIPLHQPPKPARNLNTKALKTAFNMAQKQFRDASQALNKAERDGRTDLNLLRERVAAFEQKMERAKSAWQLAAGTDWQDSGPES